MDVVLRVVVLTAIYLLVLTSVHPGDVLIGSSCRCCSSSPDGGSGRSGRPSTNRCHGGSPGCPR